jgi:hypothetical protein
MALEAYIYLGTSFLFVLAFVVHIFLSPEPEFLV